VLEIHLGRSNVVCVQGNDLALGTRQQSSREKLRLCQRWMWKWLLMSSAMWQCVFTALGNSGSSLPGARNGLQNYMASQLHIFGCTL